MFSNKMVCQTPVSRAHAECAETIGCTRQSLEHGTWHSARFGLV